MNTYNNHEIVESMDDMHLNSLVAMSQQDGEHDLQNHIAFSQDVPSRPAVPMLPRPAPLACPLLSPWMAARPIS